MSTVPKSITPLPVQFDYNSLTDEQLWLVLCHDRFIGTCKSWNRSELSGLILVADRTVIRVNWSSILFVGRPILIPKEPLEFGIIVDSQGNRQAIYVTGPKGDYLNSNRVKSSIQQQTNHNHSNHSNHSNHTNNNNSNKPPIKQNKLPSQSITDLLNASKSSSKLMHAGHGDKNKDQFDELETRSETKHLIQRLAGNLHPNGQLTDNAKSTLKQWIEEDATTDHDDDEKKSQQTTARSHSRSPIHHAVIQEKVAVISPKKSMAGGSVLETISVTGSNSLSSSSGSEIETGRHNDGVRQCTNINNINEIQPTSQHNHTKRNTIKSVISDTNTTTITTAKSSANKPKILKNNGNDINNQFLLHSITKNTLVRNEWMEISFVHALDEYYAHSRPKQDRVNDKNTFYQLILKYIVGANDKYYPLEKWDIFKFGSAIWGIDNNKSDIDVAIKRPTNYHDHLPKKMVKQEILQRLSAFIDMSLQTRKNENGKEIDQEERNRYKITNILHARCPIITIDDTILKMKMDLSIADGCTATKDIILSFINKFSSSPFVIPMRKFIVFVKYWSKQRCINDSPNRFINSFGYTLMVIKYCQYLIAKGKDWCNISYLIYGFFKYYAITFDAKKHCVDIMDGNGDGRFGKKTSGKVLEIIDPANPKNNVTNNVRIEQYERISLEFRRATQLYIVFMNGGQETNETLFQVLTKRGTKMVIDYDNNKNNKNNNETVNV